MYPAEKLQIILKHDKIEGNKIISNIIKGSAQLHNEIEKDKNTGISKERKRQYFGRKVALK